VVLESPRCSLILPLILCHIEKNRVAAARTRKHTLFPSAREVERKVTAGENVLCAKGT
jgi:hypothetical protein